MGEAVWVRRIVLLSQSVTSPYERKRFTAQKSPILVTALQPKDLSVTIE
jgi:hypothetical protein